MEPKRGTNGCTKSRQRCPGDANHGCFRPRRPAHQRIAGERRAALAANDAYSSTSSWHGPRRGGLQSARLLTGFPQFSLMPGAVGGLKQSAHIFPPDLESTAGDTGNHIVGLARLIA